MASKEVGEGGLARGGGSEGLQEGRGFKEEGEGGVARG